MVILTEVYHKYFLLVCADLPLLLECLPYVYHIFILERDPVQSVRREKINAWNVVNLVHFDLLSPIDMKADSAVSVFFSMVCVKITPGSV